MRSVTNLFKQSCDANSIDAQCVIEVAETTHGVAVKKLYSVVEQVAGEPLKPGHFIVNTLKINQKAVSGSNFALGGAVAGKLTMRLTRSGIAELGDYLKKGTVLRVIEYHKVDDKNQDATFYWLNTDGSENTSGMCKLGVYYISTIKSADYYADITAYDGMLSLDRELTVSQMRKLQGFADTPSKIAAEPTLKYSPDAWMQTFFSVESDMQNKNPYDIKYSISSNLTNRSTEVRYSEDRSVSTFREAIGELGVLLGGFARMSEDGDLEFVSFSFTSVSAGVSHKRLLSGEFDSKPCALSEFHTSVAGFDYNGSVSGMSSSYNSVSYYCGESPYLRGICGYAENALPNGVVNAMARIWSAISAKPFFGAVVTLSNLPFVELGDCISVERLVVPTVTSGTETETYMATQYTVTASSIVAMDITYSVGGQTRICSYSTAGEGSSISSKHGVRSDFKYQNADKLLQEMLDDFGGISYETVEVLVPLTYNKEKVARSSVSGYMCTGVRYVLDSTNAHASDTSRTNLAEAVSLGAGGGTVVSVDNYGGEQTSTFVSVQSMLGGGSTVMGGFYEEGVSQASLNNLYSFEASTPGLAGYIPSVNGEIISVDVELDFSSMRRSSCYRMNELTVNAGSAHEATIPMPAICWLGFGTRTRGVSNAAWYGSAISSFSYPNGGTTVERIDDDGRLLQYVASHSVGNNRASNPDWVDSMSGTITGTAQPTVNADLSYRGGGYGGALSASQACVDTFSLEDFISYFGSSGLTVSLRADVQDYGSSPTLDYNLSGHYFYSSTDPARDNVVSKTQTIPQTKNLFAAQPTYWDGSPYLKPTSSVTSKITGTNVSYSAIGTAELGVFFFNEPTTIKLTFTAMVVTTPTVGALVDSIKDSAEAVEDLSAAVSLVSSGLDNLTTTVAGHTQQIATLGTRVTALEDALSNATTNLTLDSNNTYITVGDSSATFVKVLAKLGILHLSLRLNSSSVATKQVLTSLATNLPLYASSVTVKPSMGTDEQRQFVVSWDTEGKVYLQADELSGSSNGASTLEIDIPIVM